MENTIKFFNDDAEYIYNLLLTESEKMLNEALYPGDKRRIFIETEALVLTSILADANKKALQLFLEYAEGEYLDLHGKERNCLRITGDYAKTSLKYSIKEPLGYNLVIPKGTRCAVGDFYFATDYNAMIPAGDLYVGIDATATEKGSALNGYIPGTINKMIDVINGIDKVENTTETYGGDDIEDDDSYRKRIKIAGGQYAAGTEMQYISLAKSANSIISDVKCDMEHEAGTVKIIALCENGTIPTQGILDAILEKCNDKEKRPKNDIVTVEAPELETFDIDIKVYTTIANKADVLKWVEGAGKSENFKGGCVDSYIKWQQQCLGRDITPTELIAYCCDGKDSTGARLVKRIEITQPEYKALSVRQVARWSGNANITYIEEED